jgi:hypothetical protein
MTEKNDVVLERDIRSPSTTTATATSAATATTTTHSRAAATANSRTTTAAAETCMSARGLRVRCFTGLNISKSVAATSACRPRTRSLASAGLLYAAATSTRPLSGASAGLLDAATGTWASSATTITKIGLPAARLEHLLATAAPEIHATLTSTPYIVIAELLLQAWIVVSHALAMRGIVLPVVADIIDVNIPIYIDVVVAPVDAAAPTAPA